MNKIKKIITRKEVMDYLSQWLQVPVEQLKDDTLVGNIDGLGQVCCFTFGKPITVRDKATFTLGDLVAQLTSPPHPSRPSDID